MLSKVYTLKDETTLAGGCQLSHDRFQSVHIILDIVFTITLRKEIGWMLEELTDFMLI
jgi:hypothetical protein